MPVIQRASPKVLQVLLGMDQWSMMLNRPLLSILAKVYSFALRSDAESVRALP